MKNISFLLLLFAFMACQGNQVAFDIHNQTELPLDSVYVQTSAQDSDNKDDHYIQLQNDEHKTFWLDMSNISETDGHYILNYQHPSIYTQHFHFGYFTNGAALEKRVEITIRKDSVLINYPT